MKIENFKQFKELVQLCQKLGVKTITVDGISLTLGDLPKKETKTPKVKTKLIDGPAGVIEVPVDALPDDIATPDSLSEEQMLFYSAVPQEASEQ